MGRIIYLLKEAVSRPPSFVAGKLYHSISQKILHLNNGNLFNPYKAGVRTKNEKLNFFFDSNELEYIIQTLKGAEFKEELEVFLGRCNNIVKGEFQMLGTQVMNIQPPVNWNKDYATNYDWGKKYFPAYSYPQITCINEPSDVKIPWELARLQFVTSLAVAYLVTEEQRYLDTAIGYLKDWIAQNPVGWGLGWRSTMESSLRAVNLIWLMNLIPAELKALKLFDPLNQLLYQHGIFIKRNLEYSDINGNHHSSCLLGLFYLGLYFNDKQSKGWLDFSLERLEAEILTELYPDGICFEGSIPYHRLVMEFFAHAYILGEKNAVIFSKEYVDRLRKGLDAIAAYSKPNGLAPVWGDNDDGQVLKLSGVDLNDHNYLTELKQIIFEQPNAKKDIGHWHMDTLWLTPAIFSQLHKNPRQKKDRQDSHFFKETGVFVFRNADDYLMIDCGDTGLAGRGSHGHNDLLNIELALGGRDVLVDTGNAAYTRSQADRLYSISVKAHNAPIVNDQEYATIRTEGFIVAKNPKSYELLKADTNSRKFSGCFNYLQKEAAIRIQRDTKLSKAGSVEIVDRCDVGTLKDAQLTWNWLLAPGWDLISEEADQLIFKQEDDTKLSIKFNRSFDTITWSEAPCYPSYGKKVLRKKITLGLRATQMIESVNWTFQLIEK